MISSLVDQCVFIFGSTYYFLPWQPALPDSEYKLIWFVSADPQSMTPSEVKEKDEFLEQAKAIHKHEMNVWEKSGKKAGKPKPKVARWPLPRHEPFVEAEKNPNKILNTPADHYIAACKFS